MSMRAIGCIEASLVNMPAIPAPVPSTRARAATIVVCQLDIRRASAEIGEGSTARNTSPRAGRCSYS